MVTWEPLGDFIWNDLYADGVHIYNVYNYDIMNSPNGSQLFIPKKILKCLYVVEYKYAKL